MMKDKIEKFLNASGSSMVQVMVAGAVMLGAGVYVTKTLKSQESLQKTTLLRSATSKQVQEISEALTDWEACKATFAQGGALSDNKVFDRILSKDNNIIYQTGIETLSGKITEILLLNYAAGSGLKRNQSKLRFTLEFREKRGGGQDSFGGTRKSYEVPVYLITLDNQVQTCMSDAAEVINEAMLKACTDFGGTYNSSTGSCENIYGPTGVIKKYISDYFCSATGTGCAHPYAGQICPNKPDPQGVAHNNWVVNGFNASGAMNCTCVPVDCPDPANYCLGKDLGTNWCDTTCPKGTWDPDDYGPSEASFCEGDVQTQTNSCGKTRTIVGTKKCVPPSEDPDKGGCPKTCVKGDKSGVCLHCSI